MSTKKQARKKSSKPELLARDGRITAWNVDVFVHGTTERNQGQGHTSIYMALEGELSEPIKGVTAFNLQISPEEPRPSATGAVGALLQVKPRLNMAATVSPEEFRTLLALATCGRLQYFNCAVFEPFRGSAQIRTLGFSTAAGE